MLSFFKSVGPTPSSNCVANLQDINLKTCIKAVCDVLDSAVHAKPRHAVACAVALLLSQWIRPQSCCAIPQDIDLKTYVKAVCGILDIPVYANPIESLHVLFTLFLEFKSNPFFKQHVDGAGANAGPLGLNPSPAGSRRVSANGSGAPPPAGAGMQSMAF